MQPEDAVEKHFRLHQRQKNGLGKLGVKTIHDLLYYLPSRYGEEAQETTIGELKPGAAAAIIGQITASKIAKAWRKKIPLGETTVADESGRVKAIWFHQPYLAKKYPVGALVRLQGRVNMRRDQPYFANPEIEPVDRQVRPSLFADEKNTNFLNPIYPETKDLSSLWIRHAVKKILREGAHRRLADPLPPAILEKYRLPKLETALIWIHSPRRETDARAARKRFAFEEVFSIQLGRLKQKRRYRARPGAAIRPEAKTVEEFLSSFPFTPTAAQRRAIGDVLADLARAQPMTRLLEGDVGSGKTLVAAVSALVAAKTGWQVAYMAPTEILARQHFQSFVEYFSQHQLPIGLLVGGECRKFPSKIPDPQTGRPGTTRISRSQLSKWVGEGIIPVLVGTHALIQKTVRFKNLALAIIDEQHRFGVIQRAGLLRRKETALTPHLLSMTATPIPRTLALTIYGDLDLTLLDELPPGRRPVITKIVPEKERVAVYGQIRQAIGAGRQVYIICPRIDEPDPQKALALLVKSAKAEAKRLQEKIFPDCRVALLHSKLSAKEKETVMSDFGAGRADILVATSVVEVGVNVPNATIIAIEGAERFGLAQLHQLRGRVLRSSHQAYCFLFTDSRSAGARRRLQALIEARNGFALAELDLKLRGAGELGGNRQWGLSDLAMEAIKNLKMVEAARAEAQALLDADPELKNHPLLKNAAAKTEEVHPE